MYIYVLDKKLPVWGISPALLGEYILLVDFQPFFYEGDNFFDFLFAFLQSSSLLKIGLL